MRPARGGVLSAPTTLYRFFDERDQLLYVGIAGNPGRRFDQHAKGPDGKPWWPRVVRSTMEHFDTREAALAAEAAAIITEGPLHNVVHNRNPGVPLPRPPGNTRLRTIHAMEVTTLILTSYGCPAGKGVVMGARSA